MLGEVRRRGRRPAGGGPPEPALGERVRRADPQPHPAGQPQHLARVRLAPARSRPAAAARPPTTRRRAGWRRAAARCSPGGRRRRRRAAWRWCSRRRRSPGCRRSGSVADDRVAGAPRGVTTAIRTSSRARPRASGGTLASLAEGMPEAVRPAAAAHAGTAARSDGAVAPARQVAGHQPQQGRDDRLGLRPVGDVLARERVLVHLGAHVAGVDGVHARASAPRPPGSGWRGRARPWTTRRRPRSRRARPPRRRRWRGPGRRAARRPGSRSRTSAIGATTFTANTSAYVAGSRSAKEGSGLAPERAGVVDQQVGAAERVGRRDEGSAVVRVGHVARVRRGAGRRAVRRPSRRARARRGRPGPGSSPGRRARWRGRGPGRGRRR